MLLQKVSSAESPCYFSHLRRAVASFHRERKKRVAGRLQQQAIATRRGAEKVVVVANLFTNAAGAASLWLPCAAPYFCECVSSGLKFGARGGPSSLKQAAAVNRARLNITASTAAAVLSSGICIRNTATWHYLHLAAPSSALFAAQPHQTFRRRRWRCPCSLRSLTANSLDKVQAGRPALLWHGFLFDFKPCALIMCVMLRAPLFIVATVSPAAVSSRSLSGRRQTLDVCLRMRKTKTGVQRCTLFVFLFV